MSASTRLSFATSAVERMPATVRTDLLKDSDFLRLLASAQATGGNNDRAIDFLQKARASRQALGQAPPIDLDVHLAWAMMASPKHSEEVPALVAAARARGGLTSQQREALNETTTPWNLRAADQAMRAQDPARAIAVLTRAVREVPNDSRIRAALASAYVQGKSCATASRILLTDSAFKFLALPSAMNISTASLMEEVCAHNADPSRRFPQSDEIGGHPKTPMLRDLPEVINA